MRTTSMLRRGIAIVGAGLLVAACASSGDAGRKIAGGPAGAVIGDNAANASAGTGAAADAKAGGAVNRRQYYDERAGRYYYFDQSSGRYYWENGQPRY